MELTERKKKVLRSVVDLYIRTAEPVGSKAIAALPLERIVLETDCPYMAPEPVRGTRCDSSLIRYVGEYIAQLKGISAEEVFRTTAENARRVYDL